jgi:hypothetical protein
MKQNGSFYIVQTTKEYEVLDPRGKNGDIIVQVGLYIRRNGGKYPLKKSLI